MDFCDAAGFQAVGNGGRTERPADWPRHKGNKQGRGVHFHIGWFRSFPPLIIPCTDLGIPLEKDLIRLFQVKGMERTLRINAVCRRDGIHGFAEYGSGINIIMNRIKGEADVDLTGDNTKGLCCTVYRMACELYVYLYNM